MLRAINNWPYECLMTCKCCSCPQQSGPLGHSVQRPGLDRGEPGARLRQFARLQARVGGGLQGEGRCVLRSQRAGLGQEEEKRRGKEE